MTNRIEERKTEHIKICLEETVQAHRKTSGFEDVSLVHHALPEIDREEIDLSTTLFGHKFSAPFIIGSMTGGARGTEKINAALAKAVEELGLGLGVGSQRAAIENSKLRKTFAITRKVAPSAFLVANIGGPQLVRGYGIKEAQQAIDMIGANALAIHLNPLQESVQVKGDPNSAGVVQRIGELVQAVEVPIIVKETGAGIAAEDASMLEEAGVAGIDVAGAGGTSWAAVEYYGAKKLKDPLRQQLGKTFWDWGLPTAVSLVETVQSVNLPIIASGGVRSGIDVAKALVLGANMTSAAIPFLPLAIQGERSVKAMLQLIFKELTTAMFLMGVTSIEEVPAVPALITGKTAEWLKLRGFHPEIYATRKR